MKTKKMVGITAVAAMIAYGAGAQNWTGSSAENNWFSNPTNWSGNTLPQANPRVNILFSDIGTSAANPALVDAAWSITNAQIRIGATIAGSGVGFAYVEVLDGARLMGNNLYVGGINNYRPGQLTVRRGGTLRTTAADSGAMTIGMPPGAGNNAGLLVLEDGAAVRQSMVVLNTRGTICWEFGTNSATTLQTSRSTAGGANTLDGHIRLDLYRLEQAGTYSLIRSSSTNLLLTGLLPEWLSGNAGRIQGTGNYTSPLFSIQNGRDIQWELAMANQQRELIFIAHVVPDRAFIIFHGMNNDPGNPQGSLADPANWEGGVLPAGQERGLIVSTADVWTGATWGDISLRQEGGRIYSQVPGKLTFTGGSLPGTVNTRYELEESRAEVVADVNLELADLEFVSVQGGISDFRLINGNVQVSGGVAFATSNANVSIRNGILNAGSLGSDAAATITMMTGGDAEVHFGRLSSANREVVFNFESGNTGSITITEDENGHAFLPSGWAQLAETGKLCIDGDPGLVTDFVISNSGQTIALAIPDPETTKPRQIILTFEDDPSTSSTVTWRTDRYPGAVRLLCRKHGTPDYREVFGTLDTFDQTSAWISSVKLDGLEPASTYEVLVPHELQPQEFIFKTAPGSSDGLRFVAGGDCHTQNPTARQMRRNMNAFAASLDPDFILIAGDLWYDDYRANAENLVDEFFDDWHEMVVTPDSRRVPLLPVEGNHDGLEFWFANIADPDNPESNAPFYYNRFKLPGERRYYALRYGPDLSVIVLNSDHSAPMSGEQTDWLEQTLQEHQDSRWIVVSSHLGPYPMTEGDFLGTRETWIRDNWVPLFEQYGVALSINGHTHGYKRTRPIRNNQIDESGVVYIGDGGWSDRLSPDPSGWYIEEAESVNNFWSVRIFGEGDDSILFAEPYIFPESYPTHPVRQGTPFILGNPNNEQLLSLASEAEVMKLLREREGALITEDLAFPLATDWINGITIRWSSSHPHIIATDGSVTRPPAGLSGERVMLTATVSAGELERTYHFYLSVASVDGTPPGPHEITGISVEGNAVSVAFDAMAGSSLWFTPNVAEHAWSNVASGTSPLSHTNVAPAGFYKVTVP